MSRFVSLLLISVTGVPSPGVAAGHPGPSESSAWPEPSAAAGASGIPSAQEDPAAAARSYLEAGLAWYERGDASSLESALEQWRGAWWHYRRAADPAGESRLLGLMATAHEALQRPDSAVGYLHAGVEAARAAGDGQLQLVLASRIADLHARQGRPDAALDWARHAAALVGWVRDARMGADALHLLGRTFLQAERPDSAVVILRGALEHGRRAEAEAAEDSGGGDPGLPVTLYWTLRLLGSAFSDLGVADSTLAYYQAALPYARRVGDPAGEAVLLNRVGVRLQEAGRQDSARALFARALALARGTGLEEEAGTAAFNLALYHRTTGRADSAFHYFAEALGTAKRLGDDDLVGDVQGSLALLYTQIGRRDSALNLARAALKGARAREDREAEAASLYRLGIVLRDLGRLDTARVVQRAVLDLLPDAPGSALHRSAAILELSQIELLEGRADSALAWGRVGLDRVRGWGLAALEAKFLGGIAATYSSVGRGTLALRHARESVVAARSARDEIAGAEALGLLARLQAKFGRPDSAYAYARRALAAARTVGHRDAELAARNNLAILAGERGDLREALAELREVVRRAGGTGSPFLSTLATYNQAHLHRDLGRPDSAEVYFERALALSRERGLRELEEQALLGLAVLHHHHLRPDPGRALALYREAAALHANAGRRAGADLSRVTFAEQAVGLYEGWTLARLAVGNNVRDARLGALAVSERGRAQALLDLMRASAREGAAAPREGPAPLREDAASTREGAALAERVAETGSAALVYQLTADTLLAWLIPPEGGADLHRVPLDEDRLASLVGALRSGLGVAKAVRGRLTSRGAESLEPIGEGSRGLGLGGTGEGSETARLLAEALLPPDLTERLVEGSELVVVPQGSLGLVPFAVLPLPGDEDPSGEEGLLGSRYALSYASSLRTWLRARDAPRRDPERTPALVVGNPEMPSVEGVGGEPVALLPLPGATEEATWVARRLGVRALGGPGASERTVKRRIEEAGVVHLATHGLAYGSEERARSSFVALAPGEGEDGLLTVGEVVDGPALSAELVVLSACQTGLGNVKRAEGTLGLQRAFLARGARAVLVSLWSVSDGATALLMRRFYDHWLADGDGPSKAEALRRAQADVRAAAGFERPRFWAAFQLVGAS